MQQLYLSCSYMAAFLVLMGIYHVLMWQGAKQATAGKGWLYRAIYRNTQRMWRAALLPNESVKLTTIGQLDSSQLSGLAQVFKKGPVYQLALTDFGRFLIAPWWSYPIGIVVRRFRVYDRSTVSIDEALMEIPDPNLRALPTYFRFGLSMKTFAVTLILPDARLRLTRVDSRLVEALRR